MLCDVHYVACVATAGQANNDSQLDDERLSQIAASALRIPLVICISCFNRSTAPATLYAHLKRYHHSMQARSRAAFLPHVFQEICGSRGLKAAATYVTWEAHATGKNDPSRTFPRQTTQGKQAHFYRSSETIYLKNNISDQGHQLRKGAQRCCRNDVALQLTIMGSNMACCKAISPCQWENMLALFEAAQRV